MKNILIFIFLSLFISSNLVKAQDTTNVNTELDFKGISAPDQKKLQKYYEGVNMYKKANDLKEVSKYLNAIANIYWTSKQYDNAIEYYDESKEVNTRLKNQNAVAGIDNFKGMIYADSKQYRKAIESFEKALKYYSKKRLRKDMINARINISLAHSNLAEYDKAAAQLEFAFLTAQEINELEQIVHCAGLLSKVYEDAGNTEKSHFYFNIYKAFHEAEEREKQNVLKKSLKEAELEKQLTEVEKKAKELELYKKQKELEDKENIIVEQDSSLRDLYEKHTKDQLIKKLYEETIESRDLNLKQKEKIIKNEKRIRRIVTGALIFVALLLVVIFFFYSRIKSLNKKLNFAYSEVRKKNDTLILQKEEIFQQKEEIEAQRDEIETQRDYVMTQNEKITEQNRQIKDSIKYAKRIQTAMLPPDELLRNLIPESFVLFKPRDIVSGDFYWGTQINNKSIIAAADCTGHGVPGAFMSMMGISFLNEIVNNAGITKPSEILTILRENVKKSLRQTGKDDEAKDGMDISLLSIDYDKLKLEFAGAYNPLYLYRDGTIDIIKADRMPIGIYSREKEKFTNNEIKLKKGDRLFIFSDGYADQLGGDNERKFMSKRFRQMLKDNGHKEMKEQERIYNEIIIDWMKTTNSKTGQKYEQVDDILVMGIKI